MMYGWNLGMGWGYGGAFLFAIIAIGLIVGMVFLVRWVSKQNRHKTGEGTFQSAEDILKKRYAAGEISREEYLSLKSDLEE